MDTTRHDQQTIPNSKKNHVKGAVESSTGSTMKLKLAPSGPSQVPRMLEGPFERKPLDAFS